MCVCPGFQRMHTIVLHIAQGWVCIWFCRSLLDRDPLTLESAQCNLIRNAGKALLNLWRTHDFDCRILLTQFRCTNWIPLAAKQENIKSPSKTPCIKGVTRYLLERGWVVTSPLFKAYIYIYMVFFKHQPLFRRFFVATFNVSSVLTTFRNEIFEADDLQLWCSQLSRERHVFLGSKGCLNYPQDVGRKSYLLFVILPYFCLATTVVWGSYTPLT